MDTLTEQDLGNILDLIHTCNSYPNHQVLRENVLLAMQGMFKVETGIFYIGRDDLQDVDLDNVISLNIDESYLSLYKKFYWCYDPIHQVTCSSRKVVFRTTDLVPHKQWETLEYYNDFLKPQNIYRELVINLRSQDKLVGVVCLFRTKQQPNFCGRNILMAYILAPHLTNAIRTSMLSEPNKKEVLLHLYARNRILTGSEAWPVFHNISNTHVAKLDIGEERYCLTKREIEVTKYITGGLTNREIANMLSISKLTVENHLKNIFEKLGVRNRTQLAVKIQGDKEVLELVETRSII